MPDFNVEMIKRGIKEGAFIPYGSTRTVFVRDVPGKHQAIAVARMKYPEWVPLRAKYVEKRGYAL